MVTQEVDAGKCGMSQGFSHLYRKIVSGVSQVKRTRRNYMLEAILLPPQNNTVAVQLFAGVSGSITFPALAGYVLTASGIFCSLYSWFFL